MVLTILEEKTRKYSTTNCFSVKWIAISHKSNGKLIENKSRFAACKNQYFNTFLHELYQFLN